MENTFGEWRLVEETLQKLLHTFCSAQEALGKNFEAEWNSANSVVPDG